MKKTALVVDKKVAPWVRESACFQECFYGAYDLHRIGFSYRSEEIGSGKAAVIGVGEDA